MKQEAARRLRARSQEAHALAGNALHNAAWIDCTALTCAGDRELLGRLVGSPGYYESLADLRRE